MVSGMREGASRPTVAASADLRWATPQGQAMVSPWKAAKPHQIYRPVGCLDCRMTGYMGRLGLYEIMLMSPELRKMVTPATDLARVREQAYREGMKPLRISGAMKVAAGLTTLEEVLQVAPPAQSE